MHNTPQRKYMQVHISNQMFLGMHWQSVSERISVATVDDVILLEKVKDEDL